MGDLYRISGERLKSLADQARRLGKVSGDLTPGQIEETLLAVSGSSSSLWAYLYENADHLILSDDAAFVPGGIAKDTTTAETLTGSLCHYADTLLPGIPTEMLEDYPYVFIRKNNNDKIYELGFSKTGFFVDGDPAVRITGLAIMPRYSYPSGFTTETAWTNTYNVGYTGWAIDENRIPLWANCDIPNGSPDSAEIYLHGSAPEPLGKFHYNGVLLPGLARNRLAEYPYCWIRQNGNTGNYDLLMSNTPWYKIDSENMDRTAGKDVVWYTIAIDSASTSQWWTFKETNDATKWGDDTARYIIWSNIDIPNGSADAAEIYFEGSEPVPAEQEG